jgi:hypothetical protein
MKSVVDFRAAVLSRAAVTLVSFIFAASGCLAGEVADRVERTFAVKERPLLYVRNSDGKTTLKAKPGSEVRVIAIKEVMRASSSDEARRAAERVEIRIEQAGNRIEVEAKYPRGYSFLDHTPQVFVHFDVTAPAESDLDAHNSDGALDADGFSGTIKLSTSDGNLTAFRCSGSVNAQVSDGQMRLEALQGELEARTSDGSMNIDGTFKGLDVKPSDGTVNITVRSGSAVARAWSINSSDGSISVRLPAGFDADLDISTSDGSIRVDHPVTMTGAKLSEHHLVGKLNKGGLPFRIHSSDGSVTVAK